MAENRAAVINGNVMLGTAAKIHGDNIARINNRKREVWLKKDSSHSNSFQNGQTKALNEIQNKMDTAGVKVENEMAMSVAKLKSLIRQGVIEPMQDFEGKRPGSHVEVMVISPDGTRRRKHVRIENKIDTAGV